MVFQLAGFYKGMLAPFMAVGFLHSLYFSGYGASLKVLNPGADVKDKSFKPKVGEAIIASVAGAVVQWVPAVPIDVVKINLQLQQERAKELVAHGRPSLHAYKSPLDCAIKIGREHGFRRGLYRGAGVMLTRDVIGYVFYLPVYEVLYPFCDFGSPVTASLVAGGMTGAISWLSIMPLDLIKSRVQSQGEAVRYRNALHCAQQTYREGGVRIFYRGASVMMLRSLPVNSVLFLTYSQILSYIDESYLFR